MNILILSRSASFEQHIKAALEGKPHHLATVRSEDEVISRLSDNRDHVVLAHISSSRESLNNLLKEQKETGNPQVMVGVAADKPELREMLTLSRYGIRAYFNSYMADIHYRSMMRQLGEGKTWFSPELANRVLEHVHLDSELEIIQDALNGLTERERDVAMAVDRGMSNKEIADLYGVSEHSINMYLFRIFEKLNIKERDSLSTKIRRVH